MNNPFAGAGTVSVVGDGDAYAVVCVMGRDSAAVRAATGAIPFPDSLPPDSPTGAIAWKTVYPFADSAAAVLLTAGKSLALICGSAALSPRPADAPPPQFHEKLDLLIIPPAGESGGVAMRNLFRPRLVAAAPPCAASPTQNVICGPVDENGGFRYDFVIRGDKLKPAGK